jgi:beta-glucosidase
MDYYAHNFYQGDRYRAGGPHGFEAVPWPEGHPRTANDWPVTPDALYWGPRFLHERYGAPIFITENGMSAHDWVSMDGQVHDPQRVDFLHRYLLALRRAAEDGADLYGYLAWSLLDNFEWNSGYRERFGLVHVDYHTLARTPKDSALWYREVMRQNGANL